VKPDDRAISGKATRVTTMAVVCDLRAVFEANFELGGAEPSGLPFFDYARECYIPGFGFPEKPHLLIEGMLQLAEQRYNDEFKSLGGFGQVRRELVMLGERTFRYARADPDQRLRILINPLNFPSLTARKLSDAANAYLAQHDGSLVSTIAVMTPLDHRTGSHNFKHTASYEDILGGRSDLLQSIIFIDKMLQFGRLGLGGQEWVLNRSDTQERVSLRIYEKGAHGKPRIYCHTPPEREDLPQELGRTGSVRFTGYRHEATLIATVGNDSLADESVADRWKRGAGGITRQAPCRTIRSGVTPRFTSKLLAHSTEAGLEETRKALLTTDEDGFRSFLTFPASLYFQPRPSEYFTGLVLVEADTDFNMFYSALGLVLATPLDNNFFRIDSPHYDCDTFRAALVVSNTLLRGGGAKPTFLCIVTAGVETLEADWLVDKPATTKTQDAAAFGHRQESGYIYLHGLPTLKLDLLTEALSRLGLDQTHAPTWVEDPEYTDPLVEVFVEDAASFTGFDRELADLKLSVCAVERTFLQARAYSTHQSMVERREGDTGLPGGPRYPRQYTQSAGSSGKPSISSRRHKRRRNSRRRRRRIGWRGQQRHRH